MKEIEERLRWADANFYMHKKEVYMSDEYKIMRRKELYGVDNVSGKEELPTIADAIQLLPNRLAVINIKGKYGIFDLRDHSWVIEPNCDQLIVNDFRSTIECVIGEKHGLVDIMSRRLIVKPEYDDVSLCISGSYIWVKEDDKFHFVEKESGKLVRIPDASFAYDCDKDTLFVRIDNHVVCVDDGGGIDKVRFRDILVASKGRLRLENSRYHTIHIIDQYGYIIN